MKTIGNRSKRILIVDDDRSTCILLNEILSREGYEVVCTASGEESLRLIKSDSFLQFSLLILDLMLPGTSGFSVLKALQQDGYQKMPICILTALKLDEGSVSILRDEPAVGQCLEKPIDIGEFKSNVYALLYKVHATKAQVEG